MSSQPTHGFELLASTELFGSLSEQWLRELAARLEMLTLGDGQPLIEHADADDSVYIVAQGGLRVTMPRSGEEPILLAELGPGETVGEIAMLTGDTRSVNAVGPTRVARLARADFERVSRDDPQASTQMAQVMGRRVRRQRVAFALRRSALFGTFDPAMLHDIEIELEMVSLYGGETLFREGDEGDSLYLVIGGRLQVAVKREDGEESVIAELGVGEIVGEMAVVSGGQRSATVSAIRDTHMARLSREGFERLLVRHPVATTRSFIGKIVTRLREMNTGGARAGETISTIALVPAGRDVPLAAFGARLAEALSRFGPALELSSARLNHYLGHEDAIQTYERDGTHVRVIEWLAKQEMEHRYVLYEADPMLSPWTERCVRQADHILVVGNGAGDPALGEIESELLASVATRQTLALVHPDSSREPSGTRKWLAGRRVDRHHHVRMDSQSDFDRMARFLTGRAIGLALGGGFARGLAHVGVLRAFEDLGIPVDIVGGTSMGAIVGALWAQGWGYDRMIRETCAGCADSFDDLTFPFIAFKRGKKFSDLILRFNGERRIEDLWHPYFCVSANLNRAEVKVHTEGSVTKAVLASTRAPGIFPPIVFDGELHVDGGVLNNVPVDIMKTASNGGIVIGVDVSPPHELNQITDYGVEVSGWDALQERFSPFVKRKRYLPSILLIMMRTIEFGGISYKNARQRLADLYLAPPLLPFKRTDFFAADQIAEVGYQTAKTRIEAWLRGAEGLRSRLPELGTPPPAPERRKSARLAG